MINYACIKDGIVANTLVFESEDLELIQLMKDEFGYDELVNCDDFRIIVGFSYDGSKFYEEDGSPAMTWEEFWNWTPPSEEVELSEEQVEHLRLLNSEE
jgi:hypothetical protein